MDSLAIGAVFGGGGGGDLNDSTVEAACLRPGFFGGPVFVIFFFFLGAGNTGGSMMLGYVAAAVSSSASVKGAILTGAALTRDFRGTKLAVDLVLLGLEGNGRSEVYELSSLSRAIGTESKFSPENGICEAEAEPSSKIGWLALGADLRFLAGRELPAGSLALERLETCGGSEGSGGGGGGGGEERLSLEDASSSS